MRRGAVGEDQHVGRDVLARCSREKASAAERLVVGMGRQHQEGLTAGQILDRAARQVLQGRNIVPGSHLSLQSMRAGEALFSTAPAASAMAPSGAGWRR